MFELKKEDVKEVLIYGMNGCKFCTKAVNLAAEKSLACRYMLVGQDISKADLIKKIGKVINTVPQIFAYDKNGKEYYIGGFDRMELLFNVK